MADALGYDLPCGCCWAVRCPNGCGYHYHGAGEGDRVSHCLDRSAPDYYLVSAGEPFTDEMRKEDRRLRRRALRRRGRRRGLKSNP